MVVKPSPPEWTPAKRGNPSIDKNDDGEVLQSKSQRKRDAQRVKSLAADLIELKKQQVELLSLDEDVRTAVQDAQQMRKHGARRRQMLYLAKLLRRSDIGIITEALERIQSESDGLTSAHHLLEAWRATLLERGDAALASLVQTNPDIDPQVIRQLIRQAKSESAAEKPPVAGRKLYRYLRDMNELQELPPLP